MRRINISIPCRGVADVATRGQLRILAGRLLGTSAAASFILLILLVFAWHLGTMGGSQTGPAVDSEYAKLIGQAAGSQPASAIPSPTAVLGRGVELVRDAFDSQGPNGIGIGWHLLHSLGRVLLGYVLAVLVAVPLGFAIGLSPRLYGALNPFIQVLRPISPLAWMPLALYTLKDSAASAIFIIFISSIWPILINTAAGALGVRRDWLNVAKVLGLSPITKLTRIVFPAAVPMIMTGMRISIGVAWFVIVAAEMVVGQNGIGFFIWNEWNNLQIASMIVAVALIGIVGLSLDQALAWTAQRLSFQE